MSRPPHKATASSYFRVLRTVKAVKLAIHYLNKNPQTGSSRGLIICTASNAGVYPFPAAPLYAAAKAGVIGLVRSTAPIVERLQIQINALAPALLREIHVLLSLTIFTLLTLRGRVEHRAGQVVV